MKHTVSKLASIFCIVFVILFGITSTALADGLIPAFTQDEIDTQWGADRFFPTDDATSVSAFGREKVLRIGIDSTETQAGGFQRTEGIKNPPGAPADANGNFGTEVIVDLYLDSNWQGKAVRAGLWVAGDNGAGGRSDLFGIIEFVNLELCDPADCSSHPSNLTNHTGFRIWDENGWTTDNNLSFPFEWDTWITLRIVLDTTAGEYQYYINDVLVGTAPGETSYIREVFLNSYNFGLDNFPTLSSESYAAHWHNGIPEVLPCTDAGSELISPHNMSDWAINNSYNSQNLSEYQFTEDGITIYNPVNEAKTIILRPVNIRLADINFLDFDVTGNANFSPTYQLQATGWEDGATFATLVWEAVYNDPDGKVVNDGYWWRTGSALGVPNGVNSATVYESRHKVTLAQILDANPDLTIVAYGISYGSYQPGEALVTSINFDCFETAFGLEPVTVPAPSVNPIVTCNTYGSVTLPTVEGVTITADPPNAQQGEVHVTAVANNGYFIEGDTEWTVDIGDYYLCQAQVVKPVPVPITHCEMEGDIHYFNVEGAIFIEDPPDAFEGNVDVSVVAADGFELIGTDLGPWTFNLGTYEVCVPEVITETETVTVELPITVSEPITVSYPITVEIPVTTTITNYEAGPPVFVDGTCMEPTGKVVLPVSAVIDYVILRSSSPEQTVRVTAVLRSEVQGNLIGITEWEHTFPSLNCEVPFTKDMYLPHLGK